MASTRGMEAPFAVEVQDLSKSFGPTRAVDGIDLRIQPGQIYGILGPNGAGKTTFIRMLATVTRPDAGTALVFGHDVVRDADAVRQRVSLTGQFSSVDDDLTGRENLILLGRLLGYSRRLARARAAELLASFGLADAADRLVKTYSGGMRRRLDVAAGIVVTPDLLFLDEPTTGLDPVSRNQVWDIVRTLAAGGTTVLLTTQYLDEADRLASRIAVIDHGRVIAEGTPGELKSRVGAGSLSIRLRDPGRRAEAARRVEAILNTPVELAIDPVTLTARPRDPARVTDVLAALASDGIVADELALGQPNLDEVFLSLTGHPARQDDTADEEAAV